MSCKYLTATCSVHRAVSAFSLRFGSPGETHNTSAAATAKPGLSPSLLSLRRPPLAIPSPPPGHRRIELTPRRLHCDGRRARVLWRGPAASDCYYRVTRVKRAILKLSKRTNPQVDRVHRRLDVHKKKKKTDRNVRFFIVQLFFSLTTTAKWHVRLEANVRHDKSLWKMGLDIFPDSVCWEILDECSRIRCLRSSRRILNVLLYTLF